MKKTFTLVLLSLFILLFVFSCATSKGNEKSSESVVEESNNEDEALQAARSGVRNLYKNESSDKRTVTGSDYTVTGLATGLGEKFTVTWSSDSNDVVVVGNGEESVKIDVNEKTEKDINYTLTATITSKSGKSTTVSFDRVVPAFKELTFSEYVATATSSPVVVKGRVTAIISKTNGNSSNGLYLQDEKEGGYYVYNMSDDPVTLGLEKGVLVQASGIRDTYSGTYEITSGAVEVLDGKKDVEPSDYTTIFSNATSLKDASLVREQGRLVTIKDVEITGEDTSNGYFKFKKGNLETYVRISSSVCPLIKDDQKTFKAEHAAHFGWKADVTGVVCLYDGAFYLTPVTKDAFVYISLPEKSDEEKIDFEMENITLSSSVTEDSTLTLPLTGSGYKDVAITWATTSPNAKLDGNKVDITLLDSESVVTLSAVLQSGNVLKSKSFEIKVDAKSNDYFVASPVSSLEFGKEYKLALEQKALGKTLYFTGNMSGNYLETSDKVEKAVNISFEGNDSEMYLSFTQDGVKKYVEIYDNSGKASIRISSEKGNFFTLDKDTNTLFSNISGTDYYLGTYKTYNTISASKTSYITGDNLKTIGVSQFPVRVVEVKDALYVKERVNAGEEVEGKAYKLGLYSSTLARDLYLDGGADDSYLTATSNAGDAIDVYVEKNGDGFYLYTLIGNSKVYIEMYAVGSRAAVRYSEKTPELVYHWNEEANVPVVKVGKYDYFMGTSRNYDTIGTGKISYITGGSAKSVGVSQFPLYLYSTELKAVESVGVESVEDEMYLMLHQGNRGENLYFSGSTSGNYLSTTTSLSKAVKVSAEKVNDEEFRLYFTKDGKKSYVEIFDNNGKAIARVTEEPTTTFRLLSRSIPYTTISGSDYYLGCYKTYNTMSVSNTSYISGDNEKNIDVSQFPARLCVYRPL